MKLCLLKHPGYNKEGIKMSVQVHLERFEGPLSLLLYLIRREEIDIYNIPIHEITKQYMKELELIPNFDLEIAGDFIAMAATLLQIKSKMLLPVESTEDEEEAKDPRKSLVQQLLVYQAYKDISSTLYSRPLLGRDIWGRGVRGVLPQKDSKILIDENSLFILIAGYKKAFSLYSKRPHKVKTEKLSLTSCVLELADQLKVGQKITFHRLIQIRGHAKSQIVIVLLSLLELSRMGVLSLLQPNVDSEIYIQVKSKISAISHIDIAQDYKYNLSV